MLRTKLFFDFWNFQLDWNKLLGKKTDGSPIAIPWATDLSRVLVNAVSVKQNAPAAYAGAHVYASVDPAKDARLRRFLHAMNSFPGYSAVVKERKASKKPVRCTFCKHEIATCPKCHEQLRKSSEKGVDTTLAIDMIQMAFDNVYDVAVLATTDADLAPAVRFIYNRTGKPVYNLWSRRPGMISVTPATTISQ